ncbi:MAG: PAS domain S-box protein [Candidatus Zixiibacteriota bacterium]
MNSNGLELSAGKAKHISFARSLSSATTSQDSDMSLDTLKSQHKLFFLALESLPHPFCLIDASDFSIKLANSAAGFDGKGKCYSTMHSVEKPCASMGEPCPVDLIKKTKAPVVVEHIHPDESGIPRCVEVHGYPVFDEEGEVAHIIEFLLDITQRRCVEDALRESEAKWRSVVENAPDTILSVDRSGKVLFANRDLPCSNGHVSINDLSLDDFIPAEHLQLVKQKVRRVFDTGEADRFEISSLKDDGGQVWCSTRLGPIIRDGRVCAVILMARDTTEHKRVEGELVRAQSELERRVEERTAALAEVNEKLRVEIAERKSAETALRDSEKLHRVILEHISDALFITDDTGRITYVSPTAADIFGYTPDDLRRVDNIRQILGKDIPDIRELTRRGKFDNIRLTVSDTRGHELTLLVNIKKTSIGDGTVLYTCRDISRLIRAEEALQTVNEELRLERESLRQKNTALKEILGQIEQEKKRVATQIHLNINRVAIPILKTLERKVSPDGEYFITLLKSSLSEITSPFISRLEKNFTNLTPRELEICHMIKNGFTSKQIAATLNNSVETVLKQRKTIRKKLQITNQKVNLVTYLKSLEQS